MSHENQTDEIDLIELLATIWDGKWLVAGTSALALAIGASYVKLSPDTFEAQLSLTPLNATSMLDYRELNEIGLFTVTPASLVRSITEVLIERDVFVVELERSGLIDRSDFDTDTEYQMEIRRTAFEISIEPEELDETAIENLDEVLNRQVWTLTIEGDDFDATNTMLENALSNAQEVARERLIDTFTRQADITTRSRLFTIEDTELQIANAYEDYEISMSDRLEFLQEQAQIARALNVARNTLEVTNFTQGTSILANVNAETPFYMRGYEAIEKEIDLLQSRSEPEAFIPNLRELENSIRSIRQDRTIERSLAAFDASPITDAERFQAIQYDLAALDVTYQKKTPLILALSLVLGGFLGVVTVLIRSAMRSHKDA